MKCERVKKIKAFNINLTFFLPSLALAPPFVRECKKRSLNKYDRRGNTKLKKKKKSLFIDIFMQIVYFFFIGTTYVYTICVNIVLTRQKIKWREGW